MSQSSRISSNEIQVGKAMEWAAYDEKGRLLLNKGTVIKSQQQLDALLSRGLYRSANDDKNPAQIPSAKKTVISPFLLVDDISKRLRGIFSGLVNKSPNMPERILQAVKDIHALCEQDMDAALGAVHLLHDRDYIIQHPIYVAIICNMLANFQEYDSARRERLLLAALTANLGMLDLQSKLFKQPSPLSSVQKQAVHAHPEKSVEILKAAGMDDEALFQIISQHHECHDGSGYLGLKGEAISEEAQLIALADRYTAMVSPRAHREPLTASDSLKSLFVNKGQAYDETLSLILIKLLGMFPPGSFVRLNNGEIALVIKRPVSGMWPIVKSIITPRGGPFGEPLKRDCNDEGHGIRELYIFKKLPPLNLSALWGYKV